MKFLLYLFTASLILHAAIAQTINRPVFPQQAVNRIRATPPGMNTPAAMEEPPMRAGSRTGVFQLLQKEAAFVIPDPLNGHPENRLPADTILVGDVPNDTLLITGTWNHQGPIWVFNDGVLIFYHANVINQGDLVVWGNGTVLSDSSSLTFPQQYFYERGIIAVQHAYIHLQNTAFNYSGLSHNLVIGDSSLVELVNIHQNDWTTCGLFGHGSLYMNGCNLGGEFILSDSSNSSFVHADTLILWHQFPSASVINYAFPPGDSVFNYVFNPFIPGISGIGYHAFADSCHMVMWALMPVNGSDVTISNSTIRAIGAWFTQGDSVSVTGVLNNSSYTNYVMPVTDRNLHLLNTGVQTWSFYVFDSSRVMIDSCRLGEVGCQQHSFLTSSDFLLDGSGGYFWATDTSVIIAQGVTVYSTVRSEKNGIFILANSWLPFSAPSAIGNSLLVCIQDSLAGDPVPFDGATAWMQKIDGPDSALTQSAIPVTGSAWIDPGPAGSWMDFGLYSLFYQPAGGPGWVPIVLDSITEVHQNILGVWNTNGLPAGVYFLCLLVKNNLNDSVEAIRPVILSPSPVYVSENAGHSSLFVFPNPAHDQLYILHDHQQPLRLDLFNSAGSPVWRQELPNNFTTVPLQGLAGGNYFYQLNAGMKCLKAGFLIKE